MGARQLNTIRNEFEAKYHSSALLFKWHVSHLGHEMSFCFIMHRTLNTAKTILILYTSLFLP